MSMLKIDYGEYFQKRKIGYKSWIVDKNWVVFETYNGDLVVFNGRKKNGAVKGNGVVVKKVE